MRLFLALLFALAVAAPTRGDWFLEGPATAQRSEAAAVVRQATERGWRARVVRRYRHGVGWEYLPRVEGFEGREGATEAARDLAAGTGRSIAVYTRDGDEARQVAAEAPADEAPAGQASEPADAVSAGDPGVGEGTVSALLERAVRAHGGMQGGGAVLEEAERVLFRFRREVPDGPTVDHTWARQGDRVYLEVAIVEGEGTDSRTWITGDGAWLQTGDGTPVARDRERAQRAAERFAPEQVLGFPLGFARAVAQRPEFRQLYHDGADAIDGQPCERLRYGGGPDAGALSLCLDRGSWRLAEVRVGMDAGDVVHRYKAWERAADGLWIPHHVRTWHGEDPVDTVHITDLSLGPRLPEQWFEAPGP